MFSFFSSVLLKSTDAVGLMVETLVVVSVDEFDPPFLPGLWQTAGVLIKCVVLDDDELE